MPSIKRNTPSTAPVAPRTPAKQRPVDDDAGEVTNTRSGWAAPSKGASARPAADTTQELTRSTEAAATRLAPTLGPIAASPMLKALGDGTATIDVPLRAGDYKVKGVPFTVKPGTVAHVHVEVKDGELVSVGKGKLGTGVKIDPPLDLPLWLTGEGVELKGDDAKQKFEVELGGFFDVGFKAKKLSELVSSGDARGATASAAASGASAAPSGESNGLSQLAGQMVDLSKVKVDAQVTMKASELDVGGAKVKLDPTTTFSVKGDGQHATVSGHVQLDGFGLDRGGVHLSSTGGGAADLTTTLNRTSEGFQADSKLEHVRLSLDRLETAQPSAVEPGKTDRLVLGPTEVHDGSISLTSKLGPNGLPVPSGAANSVAFSLKGSGTLTDAQLTVKDAKDTSTFSAAGHFEGSISTGAQGLQVDAKLSGAHLEVKDLQEVVKGNSVSVEHLTVDGEMQVKATPGHMQLDGKATGLDLVVDDFQGGAGALKADLGRTHVSGAANFHLGSNGVQVDGRVKAEATIDSASFAQGKQAATLGSSTVQGELTKLDLGRGAPTLRIEKADASLAVKGASMDVGQAQVRGGGQVAGSGTVVLDASGFSLEGKSQVSMALTDGRVHSSTMDLSLGKGSTAEIKMNELHLGKTTSVKVGPGTRIDAVLAGGSLDVGGAHVDLAKGGHAEVTVKSAELKGGKVDLRGTVKLDAGLQTDTKALTDAGLKVHPADINGRVKVSVDDVHLADDRLTLSGAKVNLDARIGHYTGVKTPGQPGVGSLKDPVAVRSVADVQATSAAALAGVTPPPPGSPVEALRLLREGQLQLSVPMSGTVHALGMDVLKLPPGARMDLSLAIKDGKLVAGDSKVSLVGGIKAVGVEVVGAHMDEQHRVHADLKVAGKLISVPVPGLKVPGDMDALTALATKGAGPAPAKGSSSMAATAASFFDLSHAQLDVSNATFAKGRIAVPGGAVDLAPGAKLSFHGTPMSGSLTGSVALEGVTMGRDDLALAGGPGRAELRVGWRREGDKAIVDGGLTNLSLDTRAMVRKGEKGDYIALGAGRLSGGSVSFDSEVALDAKGLPRLDAKPVLKQATLALNNFSGDLLGARQTTAQGTAEVGPSHLEGAVGYSTDKGLTVKAKVDSLDAQVSGVTMQRAGRTVDVEKARLSGRSGTLDLGPGRVKVDARQLAWDATVREVSSRTTAATLKAGQVHISGQGNLKYDSQGELRVEGTLHVDGKGSAQAKVVTVDRKKGVAVQ